MDDLMQRNSPHQLASSAGSATKVMTGCVSSVRVLKVSLAIAACCRNQGGQRDRCVEQQPDCRNCRQQQGRHARAHDHWHARHVVPAHA